MSSRIRKDIAVKIYDSLMSCQKSFELHTEVNDTLYVVNLSPNKITEHFADLKL